MADKFFEDKEEVEEQEIEKIKVGDTEFTAEELQELVGAGKKLTEIEKKQGQPIDEILTSWGKRGERLGEWKKTAGAKTPQEFLKAKEAEKEKPKEVVDREKLKAQVLAEAREFGLATQEGVEKVIESKVNQILAGRDVMRKVVNTLTKAKKAGYPQATPNKLLEFMQDRNNPADPEKAYKLMFEKEIEDVKAKKLESIKPKGMVTQAQSTAGGKEFKPQKVTKENLREAFREVLSREG